MESKADDHKLYDQLKRHHGMQLLTTPRRGMDKTPARQRMIRQMQTKQNRQIYKHRATTVELMQGLVKALFELDTAGCAETKAIGGCLRQWGLPYRSPSVVPISVVHQLAISKRRPWGYE
jgi:hypothetical protein